MSIKANLLNIQHKITDFEKKYSRHKDSIKLLAVSKTKPVEMLREAFNNGQICFGENYLQEAITKINQLEGLAIEWHFIGNIQSNKCKLIAENFVWLHTIATLKIAQKLNRYAKQPLNVCIQVNVGPEPQKHGCAPNEVLGLATGIKNLPNLSLRGLMAVPKHYEEFAPQVNEFNKLTTIFDNLNQHGFNLDTLSMGMSGDLEAAVSAGSTMVRIGTDIFGVRT